MPTSAEAVHVASPASGKAVLTPQKAIRARCLDCSETRKEITECEFGPDQFNACPLWQFRTGRKCGRGSRLKPIRRYCLWCCCGSAQEVRLCPSVEWCALWPYRFGKRPKTEAIGDGVLDNSASME